jgi:hypothetical protein
MANPSQPDPSVSSRPQEEVKRLDSPDQSEGQKTSSPLRDKLRFEILGGSAKDVISALNKAPLDELVEILNASGIRPHPVLAQFAEFRLRSLEPFHIGPDRQRLEQEGIQKETMAIALMAINMAPGFDHMSRKFGNKRSRQRQVKQLLAPIFVLKEFAGMIGDTMEQFPPTTIAGPNLLISNLQNYAKMLTWADKLEEAFGSNSFLELAKFALAGLVKRATNKYHDREVSALTGAALQKSDYDETAHRIWRIRNYSRLEATCPIAPLVLQAFNSVLSKK